MIMTILVVICATLGIVWTYLVEHVDESAPVYKRAKIRSASPIYVESRKDAPPL